MTSWQCKTVPIPEPSRCQGKTEWPELVGRMGEEARAVVARENPAVTKIAVRRFPDIAPEDFCCNRVEIWVDEHGVVISTPVIS